MKKKLAVFFVLIAGTLWGCIGIFVRRYNAMGLSSMQTVAIRMVIAAVLFALFVLIYKRSLFKIHLKDIWIFLGSGVISVGLFTYCYFSSIELSSLSVAAVLLYTAPRLRHAVLPDLLQGEDDRDEGDIAHFGGPRLCDDHGRDRREPHRHPRGLSVRTGLGYMLRAVFHLLAVRAGQGL
nr:DMT family transporter [uncultured Ruminococcus sp.]